MNGDYNSARARLEKVSKDDLKPLHEAAFELATAMVAVESAPRRERNAVYLRARRNLKQSRYQAAFDSRALKRLAGRGIVTMAAAAGSRPFRVGSGGWALPGGLAPAFRLTPFRVAWLAIILIVILGHYFAADNAGPSNSLPLDPNTLAPAAPPSGFSLTPSASQPGALRFYELDQNKTGLQFKEMTKPTPAMSP